MSNPLPFNFGQTATSGNTNSPNNILGQTPSSNATVQSSLFGTSTGAPPASTSSNLFGKPPSAGSVFNLTPSQAPSSVGGASGSFGSHVKPTSTSFNFGQASQAGGAAFTHTSSLSTPSKTSESLTTGKSQPSKLFEESTNIGSGSLFGNPNIFGAAGNQPGASTPISKPGFGHSLATSTTPAGPPPSGSGAVGNPASISNSARNQAPTPISLGATSTSQPTAQDVKSSAAPSGDLFGPKKPAESDTSTSSPFDRLNKPQDKDPNSSTSSATGTSTIQQPSTTAAKPSVFYPSLGSQASSGNSLLGGLSQTVSPSVSAPSLFSPTATSQAGPTNMANLSSSSIDFGLRAATGNSGSSAPTTTAASGGLFPTNPPKSATLPPANTPTSSAIDGQQSLPTGLGKSSIIGNQGQPASSSSGQPATSHASEPPSNLGAGLGTSTTGPAPPAQSRLKNKSMDEIITRWASDLSTYQKEFQKQAEKVSVWDRMLVENSEKIQKLYGSTLEAERATTEVERQLTAVENDQAELQLWLEHYERDLSQMMSTQVGPGESLQGTDQERDKT